MADLVALCSRYPDGELWHGPDLMTGGNHVGAAGLMLRDLAERKLAELRELDPEAEHRIHEPAELLPDLQDSVRRLEDELERKGQHLEAYKAKLAEIEAAVGKL